MGNKYNIYLGDCSQVLEDINKTIVDSVITDLPYYCVVKDAFDNQWKNENDYLEWVSSNVNYPPAKAGGLQIH